MPRRPASFVLLLPLLLAAGLAISLAHAPQFSGDAPALTAPCEPAAPAFQCGHSAKAVSKIDSALPVRQTAASSTTTAHREDRIALPVRQPIAVAFPPAFRRPPPR